MVTSLQLNNIKKKFGETQALNGASFSVVGGEIHALLGENGAGKSTLIRIIAGAHKPDSGDIKLNGKITTFKNPHEAQGFGISVVYQETSLCTDLSVLENLYLGRLISTNGILNWKAMKSKASELLNKLGMNIPLEARLGDLGKASQQQVEIARSLLHGAKIIILDEPGSVLNSDEMHNLHTLLKEARDNGVAVIYITHRLEEVFRIANRITVLRDGISIDSADISDVDENWVIKNMVGREINNLYSRNLRAKGEALLEIKNLSLMDFFRDVNLIVHAGEVVGLAGLVGAGRNELAMSIAGINQYNEGEVLILGMPAPEGVAAIQNAGLGYVPADRLRQGLFWTLSIQSNITIGVLKKLKRIIFVKRNRQREISNALVSQLGIKTANPINAINTLSGGNAQKALLAKILAIKPKVLILEEPTTGVDIGAKQEIHKLIDELVNDGIGVLLISSDLPELLGMSDRILIMSEGVIAGELPRGATSEQVMSVAFTKSKVNA